jgi:hypothetical protein
VVAFRRPGLRVAAARSYNSPAKNGLKARPSRSIYVEDSDGQAAIRPDPFPPDLELQKDRTSSKPHTSSGSWHPGFGRGGDKPMTLQDVEEQISNLQAEIEGLKETIEEVTTGLYTLVGQLIAR